MTGGRAEGGWAWQPGDLGAQEAVACCCCCLALAAAAAAYLLLKSHSAYSGLPHCVVYTRLAVGLSKKLSSSTKRPDEYF